jgi:hypothetical protein
MSAPQLLAGLKRFAKGFLAGGISQMVLIIGPGLQFKNLDDIKAISTSLVFGFLVGGLLAVQKMISWQDPEVPTIAGLPHWSMKTKAT